ncbi:MAG TPA: serine/threonine-protein kinase [Acidimicrobiales bacterium]|jgi:serine/threonine protein kinase|nr:serine/threonine-protein kinase [Acidimicrobiales bacterium]
MTAEEEARQQLGVVHVADMKRGGQKHVERVERGTEAMVMKMVILGTSRPDALERAKREVELLASLSSDHVVRVESRLVTIGAPPEAAAWLEEHLDGDDLTQHIGSPWSWDDTVQMAHQVASGLAVAHGKGVVHRDLSTNNVRCLAGGDYKVMDFGFARFTLRSALTMAGQPGTPGLHSPEHLQGYSGSPTPASDVFGVGILMYAALSGEVPIPYRGDEADYIRRLSKVEYVGLEVHRPDLSPEQLALVARCLHRQPARRYHNGTRLVQGLETLS